MCVLTSVTEVADRGATALTYSHVFHSLHPSEWSAHETVSSVDQPTAHKKKTVTERHTRDCVLAVKKR